MRKGIGLLLGLVLLAGCDHYEKPFQPLPSDFTVRTLDGEVLDAAALQGRPWVINIWVPGCDLCTREFKDLEVVRQRFEGRDVGFLALSIEPEQALVKSAADRLGIRMTVGTTENETLRPLRVKRLPSTVFVDADGTIVAAASGVRTRSFLEARVRDLLAGQEQSQ